MRKSKLDTPHIKEKLVKELAVGKSQNSIALEIGLKQSQLSRWCSKEDIRALIELGTEGESLEDMAEAELVQSS